MSLLKATTNNYIISFITENVWILSSLGYKELANRPESGAYT